jgi:hypothetical protein
MARQVTNNRGNMDKVRFMYVGQVFKSYRDLCRFLDANILGGSSKTYQLEEWGRYFKWQRDKHRYVITQIFEEKQDLPFFKTEQDYEYASITVIDSQRDRAIAILRANGIDVKSDIE